MQFWIASSNQGKIREIRTLLEPCSLEIHHQGELPVYAPPEETGTTFEENARIKAKSLKSMKPKEWVMAEDSGLIVDGLNGYPGVYSARYAGEKASDAENNAKVLKMLQIRSPENRKARFHCSMVAISPTSEEIHVSGQLEGKIAQKQRGSSGFGYDVVFVPDGEDKTLAELGLVYKNGVSHRARALKKLLEALRPQLTE